MHSTSNLEDGYIGSGTLLRRSINYYGRENFKFEILEMHPDRKSLKDREEEIVNEDLVNDPMCMNLQKGGFGWRYRESHPNFGKTHPNWRFSEKSHEKQRWLWKNDSVWATKTRENIVKAKKGKKRPDIIANGVFTMKDKHHSIESKAKIGKSSRERKHSNLSKHKISDANKKLSGEKNSQYGTCWIHNDVCNKKIKKDELDSYLQYGWRKGSKRKFFNENSSEFRTHWVNNGIENLKVKKTEVQTYIDSGWLTGKIQVKRN
jgi:hypothetical protein